MILGVPLAAPVAQGSARAGRSSGLGRPTGYLPARHPRLREEVGTAAALCRGSQARTDPAPRRGQSREAVPATHRAPTHPPPPKLCPEQIKFLYRVQQPEEGPAQGACRAGRRLSGPLRPPAQATLLQRHPPPRLTGPSSSPPHPETVCPQTSPCPLLSGGIAYLLPLCVAGYSSITLLSIFYGAYLLGYLSYQLWEEAKLDLSRVPGSQARLSERAPTAVPSEEDAQGSDKPPQHTHTPGTALAKHGWQRSALQCTFPSGVSSQLTTAISIHALKRPLFPRPFQFVGLCGGRSLGACQGAQWSRTNVPMQEVQETQARPLGREDPLEKEAATLSSPLAWRSPWTEEPGLAGGSPRAAESWTRLGTHAWWGDLNPNFTRESLCVLQL